MFRWTVTIAVIFTCAVLLCSCSAGDAPPLPADLTPAVAISSNGPDQSARLQLWGYYDVYVDVENETVEAVVNRGAMFAANVTGFLNDNPAFLGFSINNIYPDDLKIDVDLDVSITHPFPGMSQFDGYDVMGVFMGLGIGLMDYGNNLRYPEFILDNQFMIGDSTMPGGPDGYTRWFNAAEFTEPGLFGYEPGFYASPDYTPLATLCPYRYFADGLGPDDDLWDFLTVNADDRGVFTAGAKNTRNYRICFGLPPAGQGVKFGYAVVANWKGIDPVTDHPANATEAVACRIDTINTLYYVNNFQNGGDLILDADLYAWTGLPSQIYIEANFMSALYPLDMVEMIPTGGSENYSTYHVELNADALTSWMSNELWIIAEYNDSDYSNKFGFPNDAEDEPLASFFRYHIPVAQEAPTDLICDVEIDPDSPPMPYSGPPANFTFDATGCYDPTGGTLTYEWDFDNDGSFGDSYDSGTDDQPTKFFEVDNQEQVCLRISNGTLESECCVPVDIDVELVDKNIPLREGFDAMDIAIDHEDGDLLVLYSDGAVWKYTEAGGYEDGEQLCLTFEPGIQFIDIAPNSYFVVAGFWMNQYDKCQFYDPDGIFLGVHYQGSQCWAQDAIAWTGHTYTNCMGLSTCSCPGGSWVNWKFHMPPDYDYNEYWWAQSYPTQSGCGADSLHRDIVRGAECGNIDMYYVYFIESGNGSCNEYRVQRWYRPGGDTINNDSTVSWGGTRSDDMNEGFWNPQDISRDIDNDFYILDILSDGDPSIKKYDEEGNSIGSFGDSVSISGTPLRIEGSDYDGPDGNLMFVLHEGSTAGLLSIFYPGEIPD